MITRTKSHSFTLPLEHSDITNLVHLAPNRCLCDPNSFDHEHDFGGKRVTEHRRSTSLLLNVDAAD